MNIGIAAPIEVRSLQSHFNNLSTFDISLGLGGTAVNILIDGFIKLGHHVTVFTLDPRVREKYIIRGNNLKIVFGHFRSSSRIKTFDFCYREIAQIRKFVSDEEAGLDVINAHWSYEFAIGCLLACPSKTIVTFRDDALNILKLLKHPYRLTRLLMDKWVRTRTQHIIYNSVYLAESIGLEGDIIGNPVFDKNITSHKLYPGKEHTFKICFVANSTDNIKNPHVAVYAFQVLRNRGLAVELHFIGKGYGVEDDFAKQYEKIAGLKFWGFQSHDKLLKLITEYDILIHTSKEESFGNNLIEAMAKGIPTVGGIKSGAVPWVLNNGQAGILVDITDVSQIAEALVKLIVNEDLYTQISKAGYQNVINRFSQTSVCNKYLEVYQKMN